MFEFTKENRETCLEIIKEYVMKKGVRDNGAESSRYVYPFGNTQTIQAHIPLMYEFPKRDERFWGAINDLTVNHDKLYVEYADGFCYREEDLPDEVVYRLSEESNILGSAPVLQPKDKFLNVVSKGDYIAYIKHNGRTSTTLVRAKIEEFGCSKLPWAYINENGKNTKKDLSNCIKCY